LDKETGLYYFGARYYDARLSRWIAADPPLAKGDYLGDPDDLDTDHDYYWQYNNDKTAKLPGMGGVFNPINLDGYHYAGQNPVKYVDPDGNNPVVILIAIGIALDIISWEKPANDKDYQPMLNQAKSNESSNNQKLARNIGQKFSENVVAEGTTMPVRKSARNKLKKISATQGRVNKNLTAHGNRSTSRRVKDANKRFSSKKTFALKNATQKASKISSIFGVGISAFTMGWQLNDNDKYCNEQKKEEKKAWKIIHGKKK